MHRYMHACTCTRIYTHTNPQNIFIFIYRVSLYFIYALIKFQIMATNALTTEKTNTINLPFSVGAGTMRLPRDFSEILG